MNGEMNTKMTKLARTGFALALTAAVAGCGGGGFWNQDPVLFEGVEFRQKSSPVSRDDRRSFEVAVRPVSASLTGAREAGKYEGTRYCIQNFGNSDIKWQIGPDSEVLPVEDDTLTLTGRCTS